MRQAVIGLYTHWRSVIVAQILTRLYWGEGLTHFRLVRLTDLTLSRPRAFTRQRQSGATPAATNERGRWERFAGGVTPRKIGVREGLQPRASERRAVGCSVKLVRIIHETSAENRSGHS